jgi:hypothetical protein
VFLGYSFPRVKVEPLVLRGKVSGATNRAMTKDVAVFSRPAVFSERSRNGAVSNEPIQAWMWLYDVITGELSSPFTGQ